MKRRNWVVLLGVVVLVAWYLFRPDLLFVRTSVNEAMPSTISAQPAGGSATALLTGRFRSVAHETRGIATVHRLPDGARVLRLTDFVTSNGPDVRVYLVAAPNATDNATVEKAGFVELGKLKGTNGNQNYEVPAGLDLDRYRAVTIWCYRFDVNFGTAPLTPAT